MYLESVRIERFRSIEKDGLNDCGNFNVLIGKNNSGKSNLLSAIDVFFKCLKSEQIVNLDPHVGKELDFFQRDTNLPISIGMTFIMSSTERSGLIENIISEAPQMKNAVDDLEELLQVDISIKIESKPSPFSFVNEITLKTGQHPSKDRKLLRVPKAAAQELRQQAVKVEDLRDKSKRLESYLRRVDEDDWRRLRSTDRERVGAGTLYRSRMEFEMSSLIETALRESTSYAEFKSALQAEIKKYDEEVLVVLSKPLSTTVETFAGEEPFVPNYILGLVSLFSNTKVYYIRENRKEIGKLEAQQILSLKVQRGGTEKLENIQAHVSDLLGVRIDAFEGSGSEKVAELDVDNFLVEVNGSGVKEALRLILDFEFEQPQLLLVEEPEVHLHPALETSMMRYLKRISPHIQIFITTHSTNFLDTAEMKNVYLISKDKSTKVQQVDTRRS